MSDIKSFEDLNIWKEAHSLTLEIYKITKNFPKDELFGLISQIRRSSSSVACNIAEGMGRNTTKEFISFLFNSRGSLQETKYHLILAKDLAYINEETFNKFYYRYNGLGAGINSFIKKLRGKIH